MMIRRGRTALSREIRDGATSEILFELPAEASDRNTLRLTPGGPKEENIMKERFIGFRELESLTR